MRGGDESQWSLVNSHCALMTFDNDCPSDSVAAAIPPLL